MRQNKAFLALPIHAYPQIRRFQYTLKKTSVNLKPVKTLLKSFRFFPNMVAFLTVPNPAQLFELHASKQFNPPYAMKKIQVYSGFAVLMLHPK